MRDVSVYVHDGRIYQEPKYILQKDVDDEIAAWKEAVFDNAKEVNADHFIYATKTYNAVHDYLLSVDLYQVSLSDEEFHKRVKENDKTAMKQCRSVWYGVWHKGTAY